MPGSARDRRGRSPGSRDEITRAAPAAPRPPRGASDGHDAPSRCASAPASARRSQIVRDWLRELTGWLEPRAPPAAAPRPRGARRLQLYRQIEDVIATALEAELGPDK